MWDDVTFVGACIISRCDMFDHHSMIGIPNFLLVIYSLAPQRGYG